MKLTNTGKGATLLNIGDGIELAAGASIEVDAKAWAALKASSPVVTEWAASGRIVEDGAEASDAAPAPKAKKAPAKDAD